jgi:hypothetical protein
MTTRQCPQCGRFVNSMNDFIHCSRVGQCPPREAHLRANTTLSRGYVDDDNEDKYLDWLMGVYMVEIAGANVGQGVTAPPTPASAEEPAGGGLFGGAGASARWVDENVGNPQTVTPEEQAVVDTGPAADSPIEEPSAPEPEVAQ